jgi:hypothetical protein
MMKRMQELKAQMDDSGWKGSGYLGWTRMRRRLEDG